MRRIACVDVPALPLQLARRAHPEWQGLPAAVIDVDEPTGVVLFVDRAAASRRVRAGMRWGAALDLAPELRAAPIASLAIGEARLELARALMAHTPRVEPDAERLDVLWLDPSGTSSLFGPLERWAGRVYGALRARGLEGAVVAGFARLPAWAVARQRRGPFALASPAEEAALAGRAPLARLELPPILRDALFALGIETVAGFLALPRGEVGVRFGPGAARLHAAFAAEAIDPFAAEHDDEPIVVEAELEPPDDDHARLLFCLKGALHALAAELAARSLALGALRLTLVLERAGTHVERIEPARASRDVQAVLELARLRLSGVKLGARVERLIAEAEPSRLDGTQLALFASRRKDPDAAARGLARVRAAFGEQAVTRARLRDAWMPERAFAWEPASRVDVPQPAQAEPRLVRRLFVEPVALAAKDGRPLTDPPIGALAGPYRLQGGWWRAELARDYFYGERGDGALLWLFRERASRRWFLQGLVE